jgi:hypothetical protein
VKLLDFVHAYQPFWPPEFIPSWVETNLREIFVPVSRSLRNGKIKRHVQLQGWTIDAFLKSEDPIKSLALEFLDNLRQAAEAGYIKVGFSAYSHPILPFISKEVIKRQLTEDYAITEKHFGKPSWFWFPEGAADQVSLGTLFELFPDITAVVPDGCLAMRNSSGLFRTRYGQIVVCNSILKDIFMNAPDYPLKPGYAPKELPWNEAKEIVYRGSSLVSCLNHFSSNDLAVLARDWENAGSKYGLFEYAEGVKEIKSFLESSTAIEFKYMDEVQPPFLDLPAGGIIPTSWEPVANRTNPFPYWNLPVWINFIETFCEVYKPSFDKETLLVLASDIPWHFLGKKEWGPNPEHSKEFLTRVVNPIIKRIENKQLTSAFLKLEEFAGKN